PCSKGTSIAPGGATRPQYSRTSSRAFSKLTTPADWAIVLKRLSFGMYLDPVPSQCIHSSYGCPGHRMASDPGRLATVDGLGLAENRDFPRQKKCFARRSIPSGHEGSAC